MTRRIAMTAATMAALLLLPASALAAESATVTGAVLTYTGGTSTNDSIWLSDGQGKKHQLLDWRSPFAVPGAGCASTGYSTMDCSGATSATLSMLDGNDSVVVYATLPSTILGGDGDDSLAGGPAVDTIDGGPGADVIEARDGVADTIDCGPGVDVVRADAIDVVTNCADVALPVAAGDPVGDPVDGPAGVAPTDVPAAPVTLPDPLAPVDLAVPAVAVRVPEEVKVAAAGVVTWDLACGAAEATGCEGSVFLDPAPRGAKGAPRAIASRRGRYGRSKFAVAAGKSARLRMRLTPAARKALGLPRGSKARAARRGRRVKAVVTVAPKGKAQTKTKVKLKS